MKVTFHLFLESLSFKFNDSSSSSTTTTSHNQLVLFADSINFNAATNNSTACDTNTLSLSISKVSLSEHDSDNNDTTNSRDILTLHYTGTRNTIIEPDLLELVVKLNSTTDGMTCFIDMKLAATIVSIYSVSLSRWAAVLTVLVASLAPPSSPLSLSLNYCISIPVIDIIIHPVDNGSDSSWSDISDSIGVSTNPSRWKPLVCGRSIEHISHSPGGLLISGTNVALSSSSSLMNSSLEMDSITVRIFLLSSKTYMESLIAATNGNNNSKVTIRMINVNNTDDEHAFKGTKDVSSIISIVADNTLLNIKQREYNALISICKMLTPNTDGDGDDDGGGLGIVLKTKMAVIALSQSNYNDMDVSNDDDRLCILTTVLMPVIEFYATSTESTMSMKTENISMYELTRADLDLALSGGDAAHDLKPFLHKSTFMPSKVDDDTNLYALSFELIFNNEYDIDTSTNSKSITFVLMFDDVTLVLSTNDPLSKWLLRFIDILTPLSPKQIIEKRHGTFNSKNGRSGNDTKPYEVTNIAVSVNKFLMDFSCTPLSSRALISVGNFIISSTMVTNNPTFSLKFSINEFRVRLSNHITRNRELEQSPLLCTGQLSSQVPSDFTKFLARNRFVDILTVDHLDNLVTFHHSTHIALNIKINMGTCHFGARIDSLDLLASTLVAWWDDIKSALQSNSNDVNSDDGYHDTNNDDITNASPVMPIKPLQANWLDSIANDTFKQLVATSTSNSDNSINRKSQYAYKKESYTIDENYLKGDAESLSSPGGSKLEKEDSPEPEARWLPQYDYEDYGDELDFGEKLDGDFDGDSITNDSTSDIDGDCNSNTITGTSGGMSFYAFYNQSKPKELEELELKDIIVAGINSTSRLESLQTVDSDDYNNYCDHLESNVTLDSLHVDTEVNSASNDVQIYDEKAIWLVDPANIIIQPHYIALTLLDDNDIDGIPDSERQRRLETFISIKANVKIIIYDGFDWTNDDADITFSESASSEHVIGQAANKKKESSLFEPRVKVFANNSNNSTTETRRGRSGRDCLVISATNTNVRVRIYKNDKDMDKSKFMSQSPIQRISINAGDCLISFTRKDGMQKKVVGLWKSIRIPRQLNHPLVQISLIGYDSGNPNQSILEHRLELYIQPLRCFLDELIVEFVRNLSLHLSIIESMKMKLKDDAQESPPALLYLQCIFIPQVEMKIDFIPGNLNVKSLRAGDYLQLLNLLPINGLELVLKQTKLSGVSGVQKAFDMTIEAWVRDLHANQMHRIISGISPFRGLSNIGGGLHDLLIIPMKDFRQSGGVMKEFKKTSSALLKILTKEALTAGHQVTMLLARGINELVRNDHELNLDNRQLKSSKLETKPLRNTNRQPKGLRDGLARAYQSLSREVNATVETVIAVPIKQMETSPGGALRCVVRAIPIAILRPLSGAAEAVSYTLLGLRNTLDNELTADEEDMLTFNHIPESEVNK